MILWLVYTLKSALVLTLLYLPYTLMLRKESFFRMNRVTLLTILMLALTLPLCNFPLLAIAEQPAVYDVHHRIMQIVQDAEAAEPRLPVDTIKPFSWLALIAFINMIGVATAFVIRLWQLFRIGRLIRGGCLWKEKQGEAMVYCHINDVAPFSWMRNIVISENDYQTDGSREILLHEKAHIFCRHSLDILLLILVETLQWWNPIVYLLGSSLRDVHEYEADDHVLQHGISLHNYQNLLVKKALANTSYAFANNFNHSLIKKRLYMMNHPKSNPWLRSKVLYILPVTLVVLTVFATPKLNKTVEKIVEEIKVSVPKMATEENVKPMEEETKSSATKTGISSPLQQEKAISKEESADLSDSANYVNNVHINEYYKLRQSAEFPGGMEALKAYIQQHVTQTLQEGAPVVGKQAYVQFHIRKDGTIDDIGLVCGDENAFREAVKMVEQMPRWMPARDFLGRIADCYFVLNVNYNDNPK